jgi:hypothetical protein
MFYTTPQFFCSLQLLNKYILRVCIYIPTLIINLHLIFMKKIFIVILFALACQRTTEEKIKSALENNLRNHFSKSGEIVETIKIDSLHYFACSMIEYYQNKENGILTRYTAIIKDATKYNMDSLAITTINQEDSLVKECDAQIKQADSTKIFYEVDYIMEIKTNKNSFSSPMKTFLHQSDLSELTLK